MPNYIYQIISDSGEEGALFECVHSMNEVLTEHPETGEKIRKVYSVPNLGVKHTAGKTTQMLSNENLDKQGFTKYERDKVSGKYNKIVGEGPSVISKPPPGAI